jgi:hypothetical protein
VEGEAILQTTAEVSVALAGFTGVVAAFGQRGRNWTSLDTMRFQIMLGSSLAALLFSILPLAVHYIGVGLAATWAISSALLAGWCLMMPLVDTYRWRRAGASVDAQFRIWMAVLLLCIAGVAVVTQALNALDVGFHRTFGPYFLGLCCVLLTCAVMFIRLLSFVGQQFAEE